MSKVPKSFRLDPVAVGHLDELVALTGSNQAAIIEQSLAIYRSFLGGGITAPSRVSRLPPRSLPDVRASAPPPDPAPQPQAVEGASGGYPVRAKNGSTYDLSWPIAQIPRKGSLACPCGSGKLFSRCHTKDFQKAVKAGITSRG